MNNPWTMLFVDDDPDFLAAQSAFFRGHGHEVHTAEGTDQALDYLAANIPDIIFLDLMIERRDSGFRLAYEIRKDDRLDQTPIVMLSGVAATTGQRFDAESDGLRKWSRLDRFVDKPVTGRQLLNLAEELLA